ncbi:MAG: hypothetical protein IAF08_02010 [Rhizobacter sp.]|nr:hypothetical protein [Chlorobiales bacterium]
MKEKLEKVIEAWLTKTINEDIWKGHADIHIDEIDGRFKDKSRWLVGGKACLEKAIEIRKKFSLPCILTLNIELTSEDFIGANFRNYSDIESQLSWTPPSLYVFPPHSEILADAIRESQQIIVEDIGIDSLDCYYYESFVPDHLEYDRWLWLISSVAQLYKVI